MLYQIIESGHVVEIVSHSNWSEINIDSKDNDLIFCMRPNYISIYAYKHLKSYWKALERENSIELKSVYELRLVL